MRKLLALTMLAGMLVFGRQPVWAQTAGDTEIIATVDDDGTATPKIESKKSEGPLQVVSQMAGQWTNTTASEVMVQVKVINPTNLPLVLSEIRATFKKGASRKDATIGVARADGFTLRPGESRSVVLHYTNSERLSRVSAVIAVPYRSGSALYVQQGFLAGSIQYRFYGRYNMGASGLTGGLPDSIANYPITAGPLYPWPSPYDMQVNPNTSGIFNIGIGR